MIRKWRIHRKLKKIMKIISRCHPMAMIECIDLIDDVLWICKTPKMKERYFDLILYKLKEQELM